MFFREVYSHLSLCLQGSGSWDHYCLFHVLPGYSSSFYPWVIHWISGGMSLGKHLETSMWKCTWECLMGLVLFQGDACGKSRAKLPSVNSPSVLWVHYRKMSAPLNQRCTACCNFSAERHVLRDELSTLISILGILWTLSGFMIAHVISWHGWWRLSHPRKHPRCFSPNAVIYSSSFELFFQESFQFCGSPYKTWTFNCFRKPPGLRGMCPRLPDHPANHLYFCKPGAAQPGWGAVGFW